MTEAIASPLPAWESFYVIIGSSAAALTGLMFVVIALIADVSTPTTSRQIGAFGTPTVVHFCFALLVAAVLSAPWRELANVAIALGGAGAAGLIYVSIVIRRARRQTGYKPVLEDWLWHASFPFLAYLSIVLAASVLQRNPQPALFVIGAASVLLVFTGIHNAWDTVTYVTVERPKRTDSSKGV